MRGTSTSMTGNGSRPWLKQLFLRGVGIHHAGLLPKYRRHVEELFQKKLLSVCVCTETLAAGINLPARSRGPHDIDEGATGSQNDRRCQLSPPDLWSGSRPQYDTQGSASSLLLMRTMSDWRSGRERYDQIPEDTKDPNLIRAKKALKKKMPAAAERTVLERAAVPKLIIARPASSRARDNCPGGYLLAVLSRPMWGRLNTARAETTALSSRYGTRRRNVARRCCYDRQAVGSTLDPPSGELKQLIMRRTLGWGSRCR